jgi:hypothetical protein
VRKCFIVAGAMVLALGVTVVALAREKKTELNDPSKTYVIGGIDGQQHYVFKGKIGKLEIKGNVDGQSTLDCSGLEAGEIVIDGKIEGQSHVELRAKGAVKIGSEISGQSHVEIHEAGDVAVGGSIDGQSKVTVAHCHDFVVNGKIDGGRKGHSPGKATEVDVTYTGKFEVKNGIEDARVSWKKK